MTNAIHRAHPALQIAITKWLELRLPEIHAQLPRLTEGGDRVTADDVAYLMTNAAIAVLEMAARDRGLNP